MGAAGPIDATISELGPFPAEIADMHRLTCYTRGAGKLCFDGTSQQQLISSAKCEHLPRFQAKELKNSLSWANRSAPDGAGKRYASAIALFASKSCLQRDNADACIASQPTSVRSFCVHERNCVFNDLSQINIQVLRIKRRLLGEVQ